MILAAAVTMNDPWDVKSVRQSGQYVSCMKISGVPLLPPVLSKECRKEMQYYKLLAKEVEKRISLLQPYISDTSFDSEDITDAPDLPEYEQCYDQLQGDTHSSYTNKITAACPARSPETSPPNSPICVNSLISNTDATNSPNITAPNFTLDLNVNFNEPSGKSIESVQKDHFRSLRELPERDYNCVNKVTKNETFEKDVMLELDRDYNIAKNGDNFRVPCNKEISYNTFSGIPLPQEGPSSLSSKSFTGSLNDIHSESIKDAQENSKLIRQSSYTLLQPSPQLLAHLELHAQNKGIAMHTISMSDSLSEISTTYKKRRSWDLETAKEKWTNMAQELKQKKIVNAITKTNFNRNAAKPLSKKLNQPRARSVVSTTSKRNNLNTKPLPKSEPLTKTKRPASPIRSDSNSCAVAIQSPSNLDTSKQIPTLISESEDPATRVRELYEKIQNQQLAQMASLVEKQKKEQILLQQVFEEQNNLLFKQLKTICPKSPVEAKEAWTDKSCDDRGPVSLSQLINYKSPEHSAYSSPISSTLTDTNNYLNHCDNVLKKSRDITGSIKKEQFKSRSQNGTKIQSPRTQPEGSRTRTHSPVRGNTAISRKLNYDTSTSSDQNELMLTDRTNDTMADVNVSFPSDHTEENNSKSNSVVSRISGKQMFATQGYMVPTNTTSQQASLESNIRSMERTIHGSVISQTRSSKTPTVRKLPTPQECAAATKIVAYVKGYLVRRLMRTERVQGTVQTIKDALLCALQLHQDREGIRGADVDLHRRLIQQITAACYSLHDTFVASTPAERCAMIAADRGRRRSLAARQPNLSYKQTDL